MLVSIANRRWLVPLVGLVAIACSPATRSGTSASPAGAPEIRRAAIDDVLKQASGEALYARHCASCHGAGGHGDGPVAEALVVALPDLTELAEAQGGRFPMRRVEEAIRGPRVATHGLPEMPVWGPDLSGLGEDWPEDQRRAFANLRIRELARYLESIQVLAD